MNQTNKKIKYYFFAYFASDIEMTEDNVYPMIEAKTKNKLNVKSENTTFISSNTAQII